LKALQSYFIDIQLELSSLGIFGCERPSIYADITFSAALCIVSLRSGRKVMEGTSLHSSQIWACECNTSHNRISEHNHTFSLKFHVSALLVVKLALLTNMLITMELWNIMKTFGKHKMGLFVAQIMNLIESNKVCHVNTITAQLPYLIMKMI
jgi:hypothetical protein